MKKTETRGGKRMGSGAPSKYGERTVLISPFWCPTSKVDEMKGMIKAKLSEWSLQRSIETN